MTAAKKIYSLLDDAFVVAITEVEKKARAILKRHKRCASFCMAMGSATFYEADGTPLGESYTANYPAYLKEFDAFIGEFDGALRLTGYPMKLKAHDGDVVTDW